MQTPDAPAQHSDRARVWTDCATCARKHLAAAYAFLTAEPRPVVGVINADPAQVFMGRARIAEFEAYTGYPGNLSLARGCLAAIETDGAWPLAERKLVRLSRIGWDPGKVSPERCAGWRHVSVVAMAAAHLLEAVRELPAVWEHFHDLDLFDDGGGFVCDERDELLNRVLTALRWVERTYLPVTGEADEVTPTQV